MYRGSPLRSTLNTSYITALDMCKVCTEAGVSQTHMAKSRKRGPRVSKWAKSSSSYGDYHRMHARLHAIGASNKEYMFEALPHYYCSLSNRLFDPCFEKHLATKICDATPTPKAPANALTNLSLVQLDSFAPAWLRLVWQPSKPAISALVASQDEVEWRLWQCKKLSAWALTRNDVWRKPGKIQPTQRINCKAV